MADNSRTRTRALGINHVALEVGDLEAALTFYASLFQFELRGRSESMAFIDLGDQFIALSAGRDQPPDSHRHFGLVVDDREPLRAAVTAAGGRILPGRGLDFLDPWGNHVQVVEYRDIQFSKTAAVLRGMDLAGAAALTKSADAIEQLRAKGMATA